MDWKELDKKYGKKEPPRSKKRYIILIAVVIVVVTIGLLFYFFPGILRALFGEGEFEGALGTIGVGPVTITEALESMGATTNCNVVIEDIEKKIEGDDSVRKIIIQSSLEDILAGICTYSKLELSYEDKSAFMIQSCNMGKVSNGLDNPDSLNTEEIEVYRRVSLAGASYETLSILKEIFEDDFSPRCNAMKALSASLYNYITTSTLGMSFMNFGGNYGACLADHHEFTESEKKDCVLNLMAAEKSATEYYSTLTYGGGNQNCIDLIGDEAICQGMTEYWSLLADEIRQSDMNYEQKCFVFNALHLQNNFIGDEDIGPTERSEIIAERIPNSEYRDLFIVN
jgi:hypothetical protein